MQSWLPWGTRLETSWVTLSRFKVGIPDESWLSWGRTSNIWYCIHIKTVLYNDVSLQRIEGRIPMVRCVEIVVCLFSSQFSSSFWHAKKFQKCVLGQPVWVPIDEHDSQPADNVNGHLTALSFKAVAFYVSSKFWKNRHLDWTRSRYALIRLFAFICLSRQTDDKAKID